MRKFLLAACICIMPPLVSFASAEAVEEIFKAIVGEIVRNADRNQSPTSRHQWLVIASRDDAGTAIDVASTYASLFGNMKVAKTTNGQFAVIAGYLQQKKSKANQEALKSLLIIPRDSYLVSDERIVQIVWMSNNSDTEHEIVQHGRFREFIKRLQSVLSAAGFYSGEVDGAIGPQTSKAFAAYVSSQRAHLDRLDSESLSRIELNVRGEGTPVAKAETHPLDAEPDQVRQSGWFNLEEHASKTPYYEAFKSCWRSDKGGNPDQFGIMRCINAKPDLTAKDRALAKYDLEKITGDAWVKYLAKEQAVDLSQFVDACLSGGDITRAIICIRSDENLSDLQKDKAVALAREQSAAEEKQALAQPNVGGRTPVDEPAQADLESVLDQAKALQAERIRREADARRDYSENRWACQAPTREEVLACLDRDSSLTPSQRQIAKQQAIAQLEAQAVEQAEEKAEEQAKEKELAKARAKKDAEDAIIAQDRLANPGINARFDRTCRNSLHGKEDLYTGMFLTDAQIEGTCECLNRGFVLMKHNPSADSAQQEMMSRVDARQGYIDIVEGNEGEVDSYTKSVILIAATQCMTLNSGLPTLLGNKR